jgi:hypothetical protein
MSKSSQPTPGDSSRVRVVSPGNSCVYLGVFFMKIKILFDCYEHESKGWHGTLFRFYPSGSWDGQSIVLKDALSRYPIDDYEWIVTKLLP